MTNKQRTKLLWFLDSCHKSSVLHYRGEDNDFFEFGDYRIDSNSGEVTEEEFVEENYDSVIYNYNPVEGKELKNFDRRLIGEAEEILHYEEIRH